MTTSTTLVNGGRAVGEARAPRAVALINGTFRLPIYDLEVDENPFFEADTFRLVVPISALKAPYDANWMSEQESLRVAVYVGYPSNPRSYSEADLTPMVLGDADRIRMQWDTGSLVLEGRDLTGSLIDAQTQGTWMNQTASAVVNSIAKAHGLTPKVTATQDRVGTFVGNNWTSLSKHSAWDFLTYLAAHITTNEIPWVCYVDWDTLYFGPRPTPAPFEVRWAAGGDSSNVLSLTTKRNILVSKDFAVVVKGWNIQQGTPVVESVRTKGHTAFGPTYVYIQPGVTPAQALKLAHAKVAQLMSHELTADFSIPGDPSLTMASLVRVSGTGTEFDTDLYPSRIKHHLNTMDGYIMHATAKSHAPQTVISDGGPSAVVAAGR